VNRAVEALTGALWECGRHTHHLTLAIRALTELGPLDAKRLEHLTDDEVKNIDQFIFRYTSLQDALGQKTFKYLLEATGEPLLSNSTFIDRLNVLERLGLLDAAEWLNTRVIRNRLVHEYPDSEKRRQILQAAIDSAPMLMTVFSQIEQLAQRTLGIEVSAE